MTALLKKTKAYTLLTKPRIIELLLVTTVPTMFVAQKGVPSIWLMTATVIGGTLAAGGANAFNMIIDRDIDSIMSRTADRPLVTGVISPRNALIFAFILEMAAFTFLWIFVNPLSAGLAVSATIFYVFVYTIWLKRRSEKNIVIGGAAGAVPILVGWAAVKNGLDWPPVLLFAIIFYWTPPHFWALAVKYKDDYAAASVPMLTVVKSEKSVSRRIFAYTIVLFGLSLGFWAVADTGILYLVSAIVLGAAFIWFAADLIRKSTVEKAMRIFHYSILYIVLLFGAMALDQLLI